MHEKRSKKQRQNQKPGATRLNRRKNNMKTRLHHKPAGRSASTTVLGPLLVAVALIGSSESQAQAAGYSFKPIAFLGDPAPGGGNFNNDFEPSAINNHGEMAF